MAKKPTQNNRCLSVKDAVLHTELMIEKQKEMVAVIIFIPVENYTVVQLPLQSHKPYMHSLYTITLVRRSEQG